ncbi:MAG: hypothetical protein WC738_04305 [Candidatus Omnitrophota bacterium]|jgi:hypothetical protein
MAEEKSTTIPKTDDADRQKTDTERAADIVKQRDTIKNGRSVYEKQWIVNIAFLHGKQHFQIEKKPLAGLEDRVVWEMSDLQRKKKTQRTDNYILPLYRSLLSRMLAMKSTITVDAMTGSERDKGSARVSQEALEDHWQMVNKRNPILSQEYAGMMRILSKLFGYILTTGGADLKPYFNPKTRSQTFMQGQTIESDIGEVETKVIHDFNIFRDPLHRYLIEQSVMGVDEIKDRYDVDVPGEDIGQSEAEQKLINILEGSNPEKYEDAARIFEKWTIPCKKYPKGYYQICTAKKIILEEDLPPEYKLRVPYFRFNYLDLMLSSYAQGMVEQLVSHQEDLNDTISKLSACKKWFVGKIMVPDGADLQTKWNDEWGQMLIYKQGQKPTQEVPPSPPVFLMQDILRTKKAMEDISTAHDTSIGRTPAGIKSGVAMDALTESDNSQLAPVLIGIEQQLSFYAETVLDIMEAKYTEPRLIQIAGDTLATEVNTFKGENVKGNRRIKISLGSSLPASKEGRQKMIMMLKDRGIITAEKERELLEFGDMEGIFHTIDETLQKQEIQKLLTGGFTVVVEEWDDHTTHIKIITDFMKSEQFMKLPEPKRQEFIAHRAKHQEFLMKEEEAKATMQARARMAATPQPPALPPPGPGGPQ